MMVSTTRGRFAVHEFGNGPRTLLLLHPLATSGYLWEPLTHGLEQQFRFLAPDARGHGSSNWDGAPFTIEDLALDAAAVLDALECGRAGVVGMSMGGCTALTLAHKRPDLVDALALCDTTADYGPNRVTQWEERAERARSVPREKQLEFQVDRWFSPGFRRTRPELVEHAAKIFVDNDSTAHAQACRAMGGFDGTARLPEIGAPALVVVGADDYATPPTMAQTLAEGIPRSLMQEFSGVRHLSLLEHPEAWALVTEHMDRFVKQEAEG